jgi:two-component system, cell cycle sensor histidine kinase and response regulator CckA
MQHAADVEDIRTPDGDLSKVFLSALPGGVFSVGRNGLVTSAGGTCIMSDGRSPGECVGSEIAELLCPGDHEEGRRQVETAFGSKQETRAEVREGGRHIVFTLLPMADGSSLTVVVQEVTDFRKAESDIRNERHFIEAVLESIPGSFTVSDVDGRLLKWNAFHRDEVVGKKDEEMAGTFAFDVIHPEDREIVIGKTRAILLNGTEKDGEARVFRQGGPDFSWRQITGRRIEVDGNPMVVSVSFDITERKEAEEALRQSEERFRKLFEGHSAIMLIFDETSGQIFDANQSAADFYGWSIDELRGKRIQQLDQSTPGLHVADFEWGPEKNGSSVILRHLLKNGSIREVEVFGNRIEIGGKPLIYAIIHDVTDKNRWLGLTEFRIRLYQEAGSSSIDQLLRTALDEAERQTSSSFSFFHFLDGRSDGVLPMVWSSRMHQRASTISNERHRQLMDAWSEITEAVQQRRTLILNDFSPILDEGIAEMHPPIVRALVIPIVWDDHVPAVFVLGNKHEGYLQDDVICAEGIAEMAWDIVSRKRAAESESRMQAVLMHIQKIELVGQLAGGIAHDFNNMLSVIIGNAEIALDFGEPDELIGYYLREILTAAERSAGITSQLLAFARKQPAVPEAIDLDQAVERRIPMLRRLIGDDITLDWAPAGRDASVLIDPFQIDQIMSNLCVNARDAITGKGHVSISTGDRQLEKSSYDQSSYTSAGEYAVITVKDSGTGISSKDIGHIFEPFFTTREMGQRTGLGLSTVYGIVKQNNGFVEVDSEPGKGTEIRICLPRCASGASRVVSGTGRRPEVASKGTILLVEDEPDILKICKTMLESIGYLVLATSSPSDALRLVAEHGGVIDLLVTDVVMPEMSGKELSNRISSVHPAIRTLFMSGYSSNMVAEHGVFEGVNFIHKPFTIKDLISAVHDTLLMP